MKNVYIVRHCQAEGQAPDAPLTAVGLLQADKLAEFLLDRGIDYIVSSPYERARRTIAPLADRLGLEVNLDERLTERVLSAHSLPDWRDRLGRTYEDLDLAYEGGESSRMAMARAVSVVQEVLDLDGKADHAVVVSHGNLISLLLKSFDERIGYEEWSAMSNPDVYLLSTDNRASRLTRIWIE